jgi:hypothetical protein
MTATRLPDFEHTGVLGASLMLAFVLGQFIDLPPRTLSFGVLDILVEVTFDAQVLLALMTAGLAIAGTAWLMEAHPSGKGARGAQHWALPGLTTWVLSITISSIPPGALWWVVLGAGTAFLVLVWIAEFITVNPEDENFRLAANGLTVLAFALYLVLTIDLRAIGTRLIFLIPAVALPVVVITGRYLSLKLESQDMLDDANRNLALLAAGTIGITAGQFATVFHYFPVSPLSFGLALLSPIYAANILFGNLVDARPAVRAVAEPAVLLVLIWAAAFLSR